MADIFTADGFQGLDQQPDLALATPTIDTNAMFFVALPLRLTDFDGSPVGGSNSARITASVGDTGPARAVQFVDANGMPLNLTGATIEYTLTQRDGTKTVTAPATLLTPFPAFAFYRWVTGNTDTEGVYYETWQVTTAAGDIITFPTAGHITVQINAV